jgi:hypothetical protein
MGWADSPWSFSSSWILEYASSRPRESAKTRVFNCSTSSSVLAVDAVAGLDGPCWWRPRNVAERIAAIVQNTVYNERLRYWTPDGPLNLHSTHCCRRWTHNRGQEDDQVRHISWPPEHIWTLSRRLVKINPSSWQESYEWVKFISPPRLTIRYNKMNFGIHSISFLS